MINTRSRLRKLPMVNWKKSPAALFLGHRRHYEQWPRADPYRIETSRTSESRRMLRLRTLCHALGISAAFLKATSPLAASLLVAVQTTDGRPLKGAVVTVRSSNGSDHAAAPVK